MKTKEKDSIFTTRFHLGTNECDYWGQRKLTSILEAAQNTANEHSDAQHIWYCDLLSRNISWVLAKNEIAIERYPKIGETITIRTFTKGVRALFCPRYF